MAVGGAGPVNLEFTQDFPEVCLLNSQNRPDYLHVGRSLGRSLISTVTDSTSPTAQGATVTLGLTFN